MAITSALLYFIGTSRIGTGTYHSLGTGIFQGFVIGLVFGDMQQGLIIGTSIQLVYLGIIAPGGNIPSDEIMASSVAIPIALMNNLDVKMAVALAVPFGLLGIFLDQIRRTTNIYWTHKADKYAALGDEKGIYRCGTLYPLLVSFTIRFFPVLLINIFGAGVVGDLLNKFPEWITTGLSVAGGVLPAIGFAVIIRTIGNKRLMPYFIIGFFLVQYLGINTMAASIFGGCIALISFFNQTEETEAEGA